MEEQMKWRAKMSSRPAWASAIARGDDFKTIAPIAVISARLGALREVLVCAQIIEHCGGKSNLKYIFRSLVALSIFTASACNNNVLTMADKVSEIENEEANPDGKLYIKKAGRFSISSNVQFCSNGKSPGIARSYIHSFMKSNKLDQGRNGYASGGYLGSTPECNGPHTVFTSVRIIDVKSRGLTTVVVSAWQNDAMWIGKISRTTTDRISKKSRIVGAPIFSKKFNDKNSYNSSVDTDIGYIKDRMFQEIKGSL
jgi:hypothetical protein